MPDKTPRCPDCGMYLVKATVTLGERVFTAWFCDCNPNPAMIKKDVAEARPELTEIGYIIGPSHCECGCEEDDSEGCYRGEND